MPEKKRRELKEREARVEEARQRVESENEGTRKHTETNETGRNGQ